MVTTQAATVDLDDDLFSMGGGGPSLAPSHLASNIVTLSTHYYFVPILLRADHAVYQAAWQMQRSIGIADGMSYV